MKPSANAVFTTNDIRAAIAQDIAPAELLADPVFNPQTDEWEATVRVTDSGPILKMGFRIRLSTSKVVRARDNQELAKRSEADWNHVNKMRYGG